MLRLLFCLTSSKFKKAIDDSIYIYIKPQDGRKFGVKSFQYKACLDLYIYIGQQKTGTTDFFLEILAKQRPRKVVLMKSDSVDLNCLIFTLRMSELLVSELCNRQGKESASSLEYAASSEIVLE